MAIATLNKLFRVALLFVGSATLLCACDEKTKGEDESLYDKLMTEYSENRTIITTENGQKKYEFFTPLLEGYTAGKEPYREFRKGIRISTFTADSLSTVDVTITANYAIYYENRKLWEAKGDVVVVKADGKRLYTEQLFWNATTKKIYSNVDTKIVQPDGLFFVSGFVSDEEFRYWSAREADGHMEVEFKPSEPADSTAMAAAEVEEPVTPIVEAPKPAAPRSAVIPPEARRRPSNNPSLRRPIRENGRDSLPTPLRPRAVLSGRSDLTRTTIKGDAQ